MALLNPFPGNSLPQSELTFFIHSSLLKAWDTKFPSNHLKSITYNPAPNPVSIRSEHLRMIESSPYWVAEKTHGQRCLFFMTRGPEGQPLNVLINRRVQMFSVQVAVSKAFYCGLGTLFDGEMVLNKGHYHFIVFDTVLFQGKSFLEEASYEKRLNLAKEVIPSQIPKSNKSAIKMAKSGMVPIMHDPPVHMHVKNLYELSDIKDALAGSKEWPSDGLIFTPKFMPIGKETCQEMIKWKEIHDNTIDLRLVVDYSADTKKPVLEFRYMTLGKEVDICTKDGFPYKGYSLQVQVVDSKVITSILGKMKRKMVGSKDTVVECRIHMDLEKEILRLDVMIERKEKTFPNSITTIHGTLETIQNNITRDVLIRNFLKE